jgi:biotin transport system substrate-specific component
MLVGGALGSKKGALAVGLYLFEALLGLPVLSGGRIDPNFLMTPVAGYLLGFVFQAYLMGKVSEKAVSLGQSKAFVGYMLASFVTIGCGALWLSLFVGFNKAILLGVIPFLPGDIIKVSAAAALLKYSAKQG